MCVNQSAGKLNTIAELSLRLLLPSNASHVFNVRCLRGGSPIGRTRTTAARRSASTSSSTPSPSTGNVFCCNFGIRQVRADMWVLAYSSYRGFLRTLSVYCVCPRGCLRVKVRLRSDMYACLFIMSLVFTYAFCMFCMPTSTSVSHGESTTTHVIQI